MSSVARSIRRGGLYVPATLAPQNIWSNSNFNQEIDQYTDYMLERYREISILEAIIHNAILVVDVAYGQILVTVQFDTAANWERGVRVLQDKFNISVNNSVRDLRKVTTETTRLNNPSAEAYISNLCKQIEQAILEKANNLSDAIYAAVGNGDTSKLQNLASATIPMLSEVFADELQQLKTDHLARDRRYPRGSVYIGVRANQLEANGISSISEQWHAIYRELKRHKGELSGDMQAAWQYFQKKDPYGMVGYDLRHFEQEISRLKHEMKEYTKNLASSDKSQTKGET